MDVSLDGRLKKGTAYMDLIENTPKNLTKPYEFRRLYALRFVQQFPTLIPSSLPHGDLALMLLLSTGLEVYRFPNLGLR